MVMIYRCDVYYFEYLLMPLLSDYFILFCLFTIKLRAASLVHFLMLFIDGESTIIKNQIKNLHSSNRPSHQTIDILSEHLQFKLNKDVRIVCLIKDKTLGT
jgi:hypothetical protein